MPRFATAIVTLAVTPDRTHILGVVLVAGLVTAPQIQLAIEHAPPALAMGLFVP